MANEEQLSILKQGVDVWNKWRKANPDTEIDFIGADLRGANLRKADLRKADLREANLREADLNGSDFGEADLTEAELQRADLMGTNLRETDLTGANLSGADLRIADLHGADLKEANFESVNVGSTNFSAIDLAYTKGLDAVKHRYPSSLGTDTLRKSQGKIPEAFLRGCGLSNWEIEMTKLYNPELGNDQRNQILYEIYDLQASQAIQISPLFISYNHGDHEFVDEIDKRLTEKGIRFWRDIHDLKAGRIERQIDQAISQDRTVLLVLSEHSLKSDWVEHEVRKAREIAKNAGRDTLCPVALDDSWNRESNPWPKRIMEQIKEYNILDFSDWKDDVKFENMFRKLIDGLELFYKG